MSAYIGSDGDGTRLWDITGHDNLLANVTWLNASEIQKYFSWSASATNIKFNNNSIYFSNLGNTEKSFDVNINNIPKKYIGFYFSSSSSLDISTTAMDSGSIGVTFTFQNTNTITAFSYPTSLGDDGTVGCIFDSQKEENITANFKIRTGGSSYYCYIFLLDDLSNFSSVITTPNDKAHNISKAYIGIHSEKTKDVPRQETTTTTKTISCTVNDANTASQYKKLSDLFTITNGSDYYFANNNTESTNNYSTYKSNNGGHSNTTASTTLTALHDFSALSFGYSYSGESNYDYVTLTVGGTTVESKASGSTTNKTWSGTLSKGQTIKITFTKDGSYDRYDDCGTIYNIQATYKATVTETTTVIDKVGTGEYANLARNIKKIYLGDENNKAQLVFGKPNYVLISYTPTKNSRGFTIKNLKEKPNGLMIFTAITGNNGSIYTNSGCWSYTDYSINKCSGYYLKNGTAYHITTPPTITINDYVNITSLGKITINNVETEVESPAGIKIYAALIYNKTGNDIYYKTSLTTSDITRYSFLVDLPKIGNNYDYIAPFGFVIPSSVNMFLDFTNHKVLYNNGSSSNNRWYIGNIDTATEAQKYTEYKINLPRNSQNGLTPPGTSHVILLSHESQKEVTY